MKRFINSLARGFTAAAALTAIVLVGNPAGAQWVVKSSGTTGTSTAYTLPLSRDIIAAVDHLNGLPGQSGTIYLARYRASTGTVSLGASTNAIAELDSTNMPGQYMLALTLTELQYPGWIVAYYKSGSSDPVRAFDIRVVGFDPDDPLRLGLTALPGTAAGAVGGLPLGKDAFGNVGLQASESLTLQTGTALAGASTTITLSSAASSVTDYYKGAVVRFVSGTGAGQSTRVITAYNGTTKVATVARAFATAPDSTTVYVVQAEQSPVLDSNLAVTAGTVSDKTGYSLATPAPTAAQNAAAVWKSLLNSSDFGDAGSIGALLKLDIDATVSSRSTYSGGAADTNAAAIRAKTDLIGTNAADSPNMVTAQGTISTNLNATVSSRSTYSGGAADTNAATIKAKTDLIGTNAADSPNAVTAQGTIGTNLNAAVSSRSTYAGGAADANAVAIKAKTDLIGTNGADSANAITAQGQAAMIPLIKTVTDQVTFTSGRVDSQVKGMDQAVQDAIASTLQNTTIVGTLTGLQVQKLSTLLTAYQKKNATTTAQTNTAISGNFLASQYPTYWDVQYWYKSDNIATDPVRLTVRTYYDSAGKAVVSIGTPGTL